MRPLCVPGHTHVHVTNPWLIITCEQAPHSHKLCMKACSQVCTCVIMRNITLPFKHVMIMTFKVMQRKYSKVIHWSKCVCVTPSTHDKSRVPQQQRHHLTLSVRHHLYRQRGPIQVSKPVKYSSALKKENFQYTWNKTLPPLLPLSISSSLSSLASSLSPRSPFCGSHE